MYEIAVPLIVALALDWTLGDPIWLPHPIVWFGRMIAFGEHRLNKGRHRKLKGAVMAVALIVFAFAATWLITPHGIGRLAGREQPALMTYISYGLATLLIFYCLAGTTLIREVRQVFREVDKSLEKGRSQVARIVGRDTSELSAQEVRTAALETLAENLSDGVVAPLFWLAVGGVPAMMAYKMVNTLDSMIGYKTERYRDFGCWAAHIDDVANYLPARITAVLMIVGGWLSGGCRRSAFHFSLFSFVWHNGRNHASPNSGYPEAALAGILNCRFGGPHYYFGQLFDKPYIGTNDRPLCTDDMKKAVCINRTVEILMVLMVLIRSIW